ncbi:hypothetical protein NLJ89_g5471 [Agrocybe chaxingu]|uniref:F-box domain-containing protein n=1 Tax=Agrocybe chaxingu TaxID=84603 RepID=A0A9W8MX85_9AGAR|nr:hypothetical protein NLJ89_g5471 [Agrocybe chaxingu]
MVTCPNCNLDLLNIPQAPDISPILSLCSTNNPPEPQDEAIARQLIASSVAQIAQINQQIDQVYRTLSGLKSRRAEYERHAALHRNILHISRRLPTDILSEIFFQTTIEDSPDGIWTVVKVCRRWREVALTTPALWSIFPFQTSQAAIILSRLSRALQRSRAAPFQLNISCENLIYYPTCPLQDLVSPHSKRITHLNVYEPQQSESTFFCPSTPGIIQWDALRYLRLRCLDIARLQTFPITVFQYAPLLRQVELFSRRETALRSLHNLILPWPHLHKFSVSKITLNCIVSVLQSSPTLEECHLNLASAEPHPPFNIASLSHQSLTTFHVSLSDESLAHELFSRLELPSLRKLSVDGRNLDVEIICRLIKRSSCGLTFLNLPTIYSPEPHDLSTALIQLVSILPGLVDLCLPFSLPLVEIMLNSRASHLPQLRHACLKVTYSSLTADQEAALNAAFTLVTETVSPLEAIIFTSSDTEVSSLFPDFPDEALHVGTLQRWANELQKLTLLFRDVDPVKDVNVSTCDLNRVLGPIFVEPHMPARYLCSKTGQIVISALEQIAKRCPDKFYANVISTILDPWLADIKEYLTSFGWMEDKRLRTLVYAKRQGEVSFQIRDRTKDRFASFALQNGYITL